MAKSIFISDFDDTLVKTRANVYVTHADGSEDALSPAQYAIYDKQDGDDFNFDEFEYLVDPKPIPRYVKFLKNAIESKKVNKVVILTARGSETPVIKFLRSVGITSGVKIVALGDSDPARKKHYIERQIQKGFTRIVFADDSPKNVEAAKELQHKYPEARLIVHHVQEPEHNDPPVQPSKHTPKEQEKLKKQLDTVKITNPTTKRTINLKSALGYKKSDPAYQLAIRTLQQLKRK